MVDWMVFFFFFFFFSFLSGTMSSCSSIASSPWPDPNSPLLSKIDFGVPLVELFKWLDVRDALFGTNRTDQDVKKGLLLARDCKHPDAVWVTSVFEHHADVSTAEEAKRVFLLHEHDARGLCFAWCMMDIDERENDASLLHKSAQLNFAYAYARQSLLFTGKKGTFAAMKAQNDRDCFFALGEGYKYGEGCEKSFPKAREAFLMGAELGSLHCVEQYCLLHFLSNPTCWIWRTRIAKRGWPLPFLDAMIDPVDVFFSGKGKANVVFLIGRGLKGNIDTEKKKIFGLADDFDFRIETANQAVSFYDSQIKSARLAVDTWTLLATRLHLIKDMRIYIGKMIWEARFEANYEFHHDGSASVSSSPADLSSSSSASSPVLKKRSQK